mgnify:CR=1 FL=1
MEFHEGARSPYLPVQYGVKYGVSRVNPELNFQLSPYTPVVIRTGVCESARGRMKE